MEKKFFEKFFNFRPFTTMGGGELATFNRLLDPLNVKICQDDNNIISLI